MTSVFDRLFLLLLLLTGLLETTELMTFEAVAGVTTRIGYCGGTLGLL